MRNVLYCFKCITVLYFEMCFSVTYRAQFHKLKYPLMFKMGHCVMYLNVL